MTHSSLHPAVRARQAIERRIITTLCSQLIDAGFTLSHFDGVDYTVRRTSDVSAILKEIMATDMEVLFAFKESRRFFVSLVYGNDGWDVIANHSAPESGASAEGDTFNAIMERIQRYAEELS